MHIVFTKPNSERITKAKWIIYSGKFYGSLVYWLLIAVICFVIFLTNDTPTITSSDEKTGTHYNLNLTISIAIGFFLATATLLYFLTSAKKKFYLWSNLMNKRNVENPILSITENSIHYSDSKTKKEWNWSYFSNYTEIKTLLVLSTPYQNWDAVFIDLEELDQADRNELLTFVKNTLIKKKLP